MGPTAFSAPLMVLGSFSARHASRRPVVKSGYRIPRASRACMSTGNISEAAVTPATSDVSNGVVSTPNVDEDEGTLQGPALAPTEPGVSDANLSGADLQMMRACYEGDTGAMEEALEAGADLEAADVNRRTALHFAAAHGLRSMCVRLVEAGAPINTQDLLGYTPLHMATGYERLETVTELLKLGADANVCTFEDRLPVEIAEAAMESTREQKVLGWVRNKEVLEKRKALVEVLDEATEEDEDDEEEELTAASKALSEDDGTTVVVRKRMKPGAEGESAENKAAPPPVVDSDVKVTIRVKGKTVER